TIAEARSRESIFFVLNFILVSPFQSIFDSPISIHAVPHDVDRYNKYYSNSFKNSIVIFKKSGASVFSL
nr:hypothetical protein [Lachnospiraceae bacterium]